MESWHDFIKNIKLATYHHSKRIEGWFDYKAKHNHINIPFFVKLKKFTFQEHVVERSGHGELQRPKKPTYPDVSHECALSQGVTKNCHFWRLGTRNYGRLWPFKKKVKNQSSSKKPNYTVRCATVVPLKNVASPSIGGQGGGCSTRGIVRVKSSPNFSVDLVDLVIVVNFWNSSSNFL